MRTPTAPIRRAVTVAVTLLLTASLSPAAAGGTTASAPSSSRVTTTHVSTADGRRPVLLSVPSRWPVGGRRAIILLHGAGSSPEAMERVSALSSVAAASGMAVASLRSLAVPGYQAGWNVGSCCYSGVRSRADDVGYVAATVALLRAHGVANEHVTIVGYSNGGMLGYRFICERPNQVGALVSVHGARLTPCPRRRVTLPTAILELHGDRDWTVPYRGTSWQPYLSSAIPSSRWTLAGAGERAGCTGYSRYTATPGGWSMYGRGCAATTRVWIVRGLTHAWTRTALIDETAVAVAFASRRV